MPIVTHVIVAIKILKDTFIYIYIYIYIYMCVCVCVCVCISWPEKCE